MWVILCLFTSDWWANRFWQISHTYGFSPGKNGKRIWPGAQQKQQRDLCTQRRLRSAWASAKSDQSLCCALYGTQTFFRQTAKTNQTGQTNWVSELLCACSHVSHENLSSLMTKPTKWHVRPGWSESSLYAWRNIGPSATHWVHSKDSDQTERMPRLIWVFAGRTCHFVRWLTCVNLVSWKSQFVSLQMLDGAIENSNY